MCKRDKSRGGNGDVARLGLRKRSNSKGGNSHPPLPQGTGKKHVMGSEGSAVSVVPNFYMGCRDGCIYDVPLLTAEDIGEGFKRGCF